MYELTIRQIERQDFVDNRIFELIRELNPSQTEIDWNIEVIGKIRDSIQAVFSDEFSINEEDFYPSLEKNGN